jgi:hypothetical protein
MKKIEKCDVTSQSQSPCQRPSLSAQSVCHLDQTEPHPALPSPSTKKQSNHYETPMYIRHIKISSREGAA